jgi:hypothetical protein
LTEVPGDEDSKGSKSNVKGKLSIGSGVVAATASQLVVRDPSGKLLLLVDKNNLVIATQKLKLKNPKGVKFNCSVQSPSVLGGLIPYSQQDKILVSAASPGNASSLTDPSPRTQVKIESASRGINILGPQGLSFASDQGDIEMLSLKDWKFASKAGRVSLRSCHFSVHQS